MLIASQDMIECQRKWKFLSLALIGLMATIGIGGLFTDQLTPRALAKMVVTAGDVVCNGCIGTTDMADTSVTTSKLAASAVTADKITDGTIQYPEVDKNFIAVEHRDDCNCGGTGWDPDGTKSYGRITDDRITAHSVVIVNVGFHSGCTTSVDTGIADVFCGYNIFQSEGVNYAIFNHQ